MEAIVNNLIKAIGWSIFHSLWQGAIIYGLLFLTVMALPKLTAKLKHNLAYGALCLIFACFCITFFSIFKLPVTLGLTNGTALTIDAEYYEYLRSIPQDISSKTEQLFPYIVSVYGIGIFGQLFILLVGYRRMYQLKHAAREAVPAQWATAFEEMSAKLNLKQHIGFFLSSQANVPLVIGYFKPVVLFPIALATQLDIEQVEAILIHELSHIRRNDYLLNLIKTGIETLLFFNPFVWLSGRFINIEREHACDDLVVALTGTPVTYAHALLKLEILKNKSAPALSMAATGKNQHLYQRIKRITDMKTNYMNTKQQIFAITLTIATVVSLAWVKPSKAEMPAVPTAPSTENLEIAGLDIKFKLNDQELMKNARELASLYSDTTKKKRRSKMVAIDSNGKKTAYNSIKEMPEHLQDGIINAAFTSFPTNLPPYPVGPHMDSMVNASVSFLKSPEWQQSMTNAQKISANISKQFDSPEWKKQEEKMKKQFDSPAWKKQTEKLIKKMNTAEWKKQTAMLAKEMNSPEWKEQTAELAKNAATLTAKYFESPQWKEEVAAIEKNGKETGAYFESPEWKKQIEAVNKNAAAMQLQFEGEEWKKQQADLQKKVNDAFLMIHGTEFQKEATEAKSIQNSAEYKEMLKKLSKTAPNSAEFKEMKKQLKKDVEALKKENRN